MRREEKLVSFNALEAYRCESERERLPPVIFLVFSRAPVHRQ